tara:strand:+ start:4937 stop:5161 length:225 start_codon:yes stop_codon:yes gene_type:complete
MNLKLEQLSIEEINQIHDLLQIIGVQSSVYDQPSQNTYSIEVGLNKANASLIEGILNYIAIYIHKGDTNEHSIN